MLLALLFLRLLLLHLLELLQLLHELLLLLLLHLLCVGLHHRIVLEGQQTTTNAARHLADLTAQRRIAEHATNATSDHAAEWCAKQTTEHPLGRELLSAVAAELRNTIHVVSCW